MFLVLFCWEIQLACDGPTVWRTNQRTDRRTDGRTDTSSYRDARTHLKTLIYFINTIKQYLDEPDCSPNIVDFLSRVYVHYCYVNIYVKKKQPRNHIFKRKFVHRVWYHGLPTKMPNKTSAIFLFIMMGFLLSQFVRNWRLLLFYIRQKASRQTGFLCVRIKKE